MRLIVAVAVGTLLSAALAGAPAKAAFLHLWPSRDYVEVELSIPRGSPAPYRALMDFDQRAHMVCPFDFRTETSVLAYVPADLKPSPGKRLAGLAVVKARAVPDSRELFAQCSDVLSSFDHRTHDTGADSYLWAPRKLTKRFSFDQMDLEDRAHNAIVFSGLPIVSDMKSTLAYCVEMRSDADHPPSYWLAMVGISLPGWAEERKLPDTTCAEAIQTLY